MIGWIFLTKTISINPSDTRYVSGDTRTGSDSQFESAILILALPQTHNAGKGGCASYAGPGVRRVWLGEGRGFEICVSRLAFVGNVLGVRFAALLLFAGSSILQEQRGTRQTARAGVVVRWEGLDH